MSHSGFNRLHQGWISCFIFGNRLKNNMMIAASPMTLCVPEKKMKCHSNHYLERILRKMADWSKVLNPLFDRGQSRSRCELSRYAWVFGTPCGSRSVIGVGGSCTKYQVHLGARYTEVQPGGASARCGDR